MLKRSAHLVCFLVSVWAIQATGNPTPNEKELVDTDISPPNLLAAVKNGAETFTAGKFEPYPELEEIDLCDNATVDAIFILQDSTTYIFRGPYFWKVVHDKIEPEYPKLIRDHWKHLPDDLDAAFTYKNDQIIFFKGSKYWKYTNFKLDEGYPRYIKEGFPGIPDHIQGATTWGKKGFIYFFKESEYWRYEPNCVHPVKKTYPKPISEVWEGIPNYLDEVLLHTNGVLYFLKGVRYWRFNDESLSVYVGKDITYPTLTAPQWFSCKPIP